MRKFKADYLFTGKEMAEAGSVLVTEDDGTVINILPPGEVGGARGPGVRSETGDGIETLSGLLTPGFINCHCHLELSHMKGVLPEKTGLIDFLVAVIRGRGASANEPSTILEAIARAEESMLHNGIVAVGDICNTSVTVPQKAEGRLYYHNFIETMGFTGQGAPDRYAAALKVFQDFAETYSLPIEANSLAPHAPYSVSHRLFQLIANFPGNHLLTIHNQESPEENKFLQTGQGDFLRLYKALGLDTSFFTGTGKRSLESYLPHFHRNQTLLLVHNVDTGEEDLQWLQEWKGSTTEGRGVPNVFFCLCPNANLYIAGQLPDVDLLMRYSCPITLGTDSLASNQQLDILEEMKTLQQHFRELDTATLLQWATANGARALQLDSMLGDFAPGKQPGVVLVSAIEEGRFTKNSHALRII